MMGVQYGVQVPKYLNSQIQILWWELDEFAIMFGFFCCAMYFGGIGFWLALIIVPWVYSRGKKLGARGYLKHLFIRWGLASIKGYPTTFENKFRE